MENYEKAEKDYMAGMKYKDIAEKYGTTINTVKSWKKRYGWNRKEGAHKKEKVCTQNKRVERVAPVQPEDGTKETLQNDELTPEQQMFCIYYSRTFNATQSYLKAYGCNYETALRAGPRLLGNVGVRAEIERLREIKRQQIVVSEEDIVELQMRIAFSDIGNYISFGKTEIETKSGEVIEVNSVDLKESIMTDTQLVRKVSEGKNGISIEVEDRQKAISWLTKYFLMHPEDKYKAEFDRKRAEVKDNSTGEILKNMQTITDILQHPVSNRSIEDFEGVQENE
ncbi:MAG: terminase small subunit [Lachnospiraceae bacterium]|nr:terminase small subunit [Lachnospiraceae bacterium]